MTPDERQMLTSLFDRVRQAGVQPRDPEAEALIAEQVRAQPYAPYLLSQTVIVQEQALTAAAARIEELEAELKRAQERTSEAPAASGFLGGIGKSLFGDAPRGRSSVPPTGGPSAAPGVWTQQGRPVEPPAQGFGQQPMQPPQGFGQLPMQQATPWGQRPGGGFLQGALGAAAGVAGGVLLANTIGGLMGGHKEANAATPPANPAATPAPAASQTAAADPGSDSAGSDYQNASYDEDAMDSGLGDWGDDSADI